MFFTGSSSSGTDRVTNSICLEFEEGILGKFEVFFFGWITKYYIFHYSIL
jgi:hypothetical protein